MSYSYLVDHVVKTTWCAPDQDKQAIIQPAKLTPFGGVWNKVDILWRTYTLPEPKVRFHVYQIGQLHPLLLGLFPSRKWMTVAENCNLMNMVVDIYSERGIEFPRIEAWYMVTEDKNLIFALKEQDSVPINIDTEKMFVRVYTNAYFDSLRRLPDAHGIEVTGKRILNTQEILDMQVVFQDYTTRPYGKAYGYVNGMFVSTIDLLTVQVGDVVEMLYDSSIKKVVDFNVKTLKDFVSWLDSSRKYLLHYAGKQSVLDYQDDIDIHLIKKQSGNRYRGIYFHKNDPTALRNVTHKDYSVPVHRVVNFTDGIEEWNDPNELTLRLHIRHSGFGEQKHLIFENNRIHELYKMKDADLTRAMLGIDATLEFWQAANLEGSAYTAIMASRTSCISRELTEEALGYNAISSEIGFTPKFTRMSSNQNIADVPYVLQEGAVVHEYDKDGILIDWSNHLPGATYKARDNGTKLVEMLGGIGAEMLDETYGQQTTTLDPNNSYRFYTCEIRNGNPTNVWKDVTGESVYAVVNNKVTWFVDPLTTYTLVRGDSVTLAYTARYTPTGGVLKFSLKHKAFRNGIIGDWVMQIPMGQLDVWLNGKSLIKDIDYVINFPEIVITTREYFTSDPNGEQRVDIRFAGFCTKDLELEPTGDYGWVNKDQLSRNNRYDIRDDKVLRITAGGRTFDRSQLKFAETSGTVFIANMNGKPYQIKDIVVPVRNTTPSDTYVLREPAQVIDKRISDYLSAKLPQPASNQPNPILNPYQLYSPFICKILYDLKSGILDDPGMYQHMSDQYVVDMVEPYTYLLKFDPTQPTSQVKDSEYVTIRPHNLDTVIDLYVWKYRFLARVVELYSNGLVTLSHFVRLVLEP